MPLFPPDKRTDKRQKRKLLARRILPPLLLILFVAVGFQLLSDTGLIHHYVLPSPSQVARSLVQDFPVMGDHLVHTLRVASLGFLLSALTGAVSALLMDRFKLLSDTVYPLVVISQTIPTLVITPVIVLIFGYGDWARLFVVILVCFFPVTVSLMQGLRSVDRDLLRMMETMGASRMATLRHVKIPASLPAFFAGIRISSTYCVMAAVLAEWAGGGEGIGIYMLRTKRSFRYDAMFASILWIVVLSLVFYLLAVLLEYFALPWRDKTEIRTSQELPS